MADISIFVFFFFAFLISFLCSRMQILFSLTEASQDNLNTDKLKGVKMSAINICFA